jgi:hypothetical protein
MLGQAVGGRVRRQIRRLGGVMDAVRLERRVWAVLLDQTSLAGVLELGRRETLLVRIGVVLKKRSVSGWLAGVSDKAIVRATRARGCYCRVKQQRDTPSARAAQQVSGEATDPCWGATVAAEIGGR